MRRSLRITATYTTTHLAQAYRDGLGLKVIQNITGVGYETVREAILVEGEQLRGRHRRPLNPGMSLGPSAQEELAMHVEAEKRTRLKLQPGQCPYYRIVDFDTRVSSPATCATWKSPRWVCCEGCQHG